MDGIPPHSTGLCHLSGPLHKKDGDGDNDFDDNVGNNDDNDNNDGESSSCVRMMDLGPKQAEIN